MTYLDTKVGVAEAFSGSSGAKSFLLHIWSVFSVSPLWKSRNPIGPSRGQRPDGAKPQRQNQILHLSFPTCFFFSFKFSLFLEDGENFKRDDRRSNEEQFLSRFVTRLKWTEIEKKRSMRKMVAISGSGAVIVGKTIYLDMKDFGWCFSAWTEGCTD